jgi:hypothetical protein
MTQPFFTTTVAVRDFLDLDVDATSKYTDQTIGSNIRAASVFLERATGRYLGDRTATLKFTTNGAASLTIPGLRTATSVTMAGSALTVDDSYWLIPDAQQTGVYTGLALRGYNERADGPAYLAYSDWFDTNRDQFYRRGFGFPSLPNDLVIVGTWGYIDNVDFPEPIRFAAKVQAAFYTKYPDAVLVGALQTANDGSIDLSGFPLPVQQFVTDWRLSVGGVAQA